MNWLTIALSIFALIIAIRVLSPSSPTADWVIGLQGWVGGLSGGSPLRALIIVAFAFIVGYLVFAYAYKPWASTSTILDKGPILLSEDKIYTFSPAAFDMNAFTFTFYINPQTGNRTAITSGDINANYSIFELTECFSLQLLPAGANGKTGTQLQVKTIDQTVETIQLTAIPFQKWTYVGITIEGRRVDVSYNGRIVSSTVLGKMPQTNMNGRLQSGNKRIMGTLAFVAFAPYRMPIDQIMIDYVSTSNTRGEPYIGAQLPTIGNLFTCPAGIFCFKPNKPPAAAGASWYTPYA
jgi:hypothetical protein